MTRVYSRLPLQLTTRVTPLRFRRWRKLRSVTLSFASIGRKDPRPMGKVKGVWGGGAFAPHLFFQRKPIICWINSN